MVRKRVIVAGRVQGVGFRIACARQAQAAGVAGSVRNLPDGRVEAIFEGDAAAVDACVSWSEQGPSYARVHSVNVFDEDPRGGTDFHIK
jgi:acylphosphatase